MSTRSTRSKRPPITENISSKITSEFPNNDVVIIKRSMRSRKGKNTPSLQTECQSVLEESHTRKILSEKFDITDQISSTNVHSKSKRSRKEVSNVRPAGIVENKINNIKNMEEASTIIKTKLPLKISTRKSTRNNKHPPALDSDKSALLELTFKEVNKENEIGHFTSLKTKKKSKRGKEIIIETSFKSDDDNEISLPSKRGSTSAVSLVAASAPRTRKAVRNLDNPSEALTSEVTTTKHKGQKKKPKTSQELINIENVPITDIKDVKNLSNISNNTLYHSLDGLDYPNIIHKDNLSFSSAKEFNLSDSKHSSLTTSNSNGNETEACINISLPKPRKTISESSNRDCSRILNDTYPILVDDSITSDSSFKDKASKIFYISSKETSLMDASGFMKNSKNNMRISGIEEIFAGSDPVTRKSLKREGTYTKKEVSPKSTENFNFDKTTDTSHNQSQFSRRHVFSAASPCKLFPKRASVNTDKGKMNAHNSTFATTPLKTTCRAIYVGSAGRTPMPPPDKSSEKSILLEEKSTPVKKPVLLNVTRSLEKPKEQEVKASIISDASVKKKTKVGFCSTNKTQMSRIPNASKTIKSNLKGSNKSFILANSVTNKQGTRKRSISQNDTEIKGAKIRKLGLREFIANKRCVVQPTTPASAGKHLCGKANASLCSTTPAKQTGLKLAAPLSRSKIPDFASLHKKQFEQMESLVQNKARKAERARQLLFPNLPEGFKSFNKPASSADLGFTRFGFKLQSDSQNTLPVAKSNKKAEARKVIMRDEKPSAIEKRRMENRNYVKGVRTNRRFELQMQSRNLQA